MNLFNFKGASIGVVLMASMFATGCASTYTNVAPTPPANYEVLGSVSGNSTGSLGLLATAYYFVPMGANERVEKAYSRALSKYPEATGLINVEYSEDWYWWLIGTARTVTVKGTAIKEISE